MSTPSLFTVELPLPDDTDRLGAALADVLIALRPQIDAAESGLAMRLEGDLRMDGCSQKPDLYAAGNL